MIEEKRDLPGEGKGVVFSFPVVEGEDGNATRRDGGARREKERKKGKPARVAKGEPRDG